MNDFQFYAIRIKGTDFFKTSGEMFGTFEEAMAQGVFYNTRKTAEKYLKRYREMYYGGTDAYPNGMRFRIGDEYFTSNQEAIKFAEYDLKFMSPEFEIVDLKMTACSNKMVDQSWVENPDRSGGQFTPYEVSDHGRWI